MSVFSSTTGWAKPRVNRGARNAHLFPEITTRVNRIVTGARAETAVANRVLQDYVELWHKLKSGRPCTCTRAKQREAIEHQVDAHEGFRIEDFLITSDLNLGVTKEFCPLCFSTGIIGGFKRSGVDSIILEASSEPKTKDVHLIREKPWWYQAGPEWGSVTWTLTVPQYFNTAVDIFVRWQNRPPSEYKILLNGEDLSLDLLNAMKGETVEIQVCMKDTSNEDDNVGLIAVWLQLETTHGMVPAEFPNLQEVFTGALNVYGEFNGPITVNFDGTQGEITPFDIIIQHSKRSSQMGLCWRITQVEQDSTLDINVDYNCEARLVRAFENYYLIPSKAARLRYPMKEYTFVE
jgi:hypothetical protein